MTPDEFLQAVLDEQELSDNSAEMKELKAKREEVEGRLRSAFADSSLTIRYGGSKAKGTMNRLSYDLDLTCYFEFDDGEPGDTLAELFESVEEALEKYYEVERKTSALRLKGEDGVYVHVDVVPGRFVDEEEADTWLYRAKGDKERLRTNLEVHVAFVKESGVTDAIRLMKLWRHFMSVGIRTFPLELVVIEILKRKKNSSLSDQMAFMMKRLRDEIDEVEIADPANPTGNDLSELWNEDVRRRVSEAAGRTMELVKKGGWEAVFLAQKAIDVARVKKAVERVSVPTRPWLPKG